MRHFWQSVRSDYEDNFRPANIKFLQERVHLGTLHQLIIDDLGTYRLLGDYDLVAALLRRGEDRVL